MKHMYKVWVHIEKVTAGGDVLEGDEFHEPHEAGCMKSLKKAQQLVDTLIEAAHGPRAVVEVRGGVADVIDYGLPNAQVVILDYDNIEAGDEPPVPMPDDGDTSLGAAAIRDAWYVYNRNNKEDA